MKYDHYTADGVSEASGKLVADASEPSESQSLRSWLRRIVGVVASATAVIMFAAYIVLLVAFIALTIKACDSQGCEPITITILGVPLGVIIVGVPFCALIMALLISLIHD